MDALAREAALDGVRVSLWWLLFMGAMVLGLRQRGVRSGPGWTLWRLISGTIACQALWASMWAVHNAAVRSVGLGRLTDALYRACIPLEQLATASFMGLLLVLAAGFCITRNNLGPYKAQVLGLPSLIFVTGVVTQYISFGLLEASTDQLDVLDFAEWEAGLFAVCTFLNVAAFLFWVVFIFEIIQAEVDALRAQQELNLVRSAAPAAPRQPPGGVVGAAAHAAPPPGLDPAWAAAAAEEGVVAYRNLLGAGQNISHVPGADADCQEIQTVADLLNYKTKRAMYRRFSTGFGVYMIAQLCVILAPVFVLDSVQTVIAGTQFAVMFGFLAALLVLFRPVEDSPYLLMGGDMDMVGQLDTELGVEQQQENDGGPVAGAWGRAGAGGVELAAARLGTSAKPVTAAVLGGGERDRGGGRDQSGGGSGLPVSAHARDGFGGGGGRGSGSTPPTPAARPAALTAAAAAAATAGGGSSSTSLTDLPVRPPAIRTSIAGPPPAPAAGAAAPRWSLGEDELQEISLSHGQSPPKP